MHELKAHPTASYFVMIDPRNSSWYYTATQAGAYVSTDAGANWSAYHVVMHSRSGVTIDRVPHDYQRIVPDFRGDGVAFPSDQGLHIANGSGVHLVPELTSAVGDMANTMALSALVSPSATTPGSRNLIVNLWDWDVAASWDDGATWAGWAPAEKSPGACGEGGGGTGMGASGKLVMFHKNHWYSSHDGGHNFIRGDLPGGGGAFDYVRRPGSRSEPSGRCFALMNAPAGAEAAARGSSSSSSSSRNRPPPQRQKQHRSGVWQSKLQCNDGKPLRKSRKSAGVVSSRIRCRSRVILTKVSALVLVDRLQTWLLSTGKKIECVTCE